LEVNGKKIVLGLYIGGNIVSRLAKNVSWFMVCNGQNFWNHQKRVTFGQNV